MNKKITRRAVIGTVIGALVAGPFVIRHFRLPKQLPEGEHSNSFTKEYNYFLDRVSFPREYKTQVNPLLPSEKRETLLRIHRRFWQNYSRIDEAEFDYHFRTIIDGKVEPNVWSMDARVKMKYGFGMDIKGTNTEGKPIHLYFNMKGEVAPEGRGQSDLSSMMLSFFSSFIARPEMAGAYVDVEEGVKLPDNPHIKGHGLYDVLRLLSEKTDEKLHYYSRETGIFELETIRKTNTSGIGYQCLEYISVSGVMLPVRDETHSRDGTTIIVNKYSNIAVKLIS